MKFTCTNKDQFNSLIELSSVLKSPKFSLSGSFDANEEAIEKLILSEFWPKAVPDSMIVRSQEAVSHRSKAIITSFIGNLENKKFLDYGCGDGSCVITAAVQANYAAGFDIKENDEWIDGINLTTDFSKIKENGPYDVILLYDVFDHIPEDQINGCLNQIHSVCHPKTKIRVRCHPWTSIHGGHIYESINKAYAHLFLSNDQLEKYQATFVRKITRPMKVYNSAWEQANFVVEKTETHKINWEHNNIGEFFGESDISNFLNTESPQKLLGSQEWQKTVLPVEFIDFTLTCK